MKFEVRDESSCKDTNPKDAVGTKKSPVSCVPMTFIAAVGLAMLEGALKYRRHNYRVSGVRLSVYVDAIFRHMAAMWEGEWEDKDSGLPHIVKIGACCAVVYDAYLLGKLIDDRPPKHKDGWMGEMNKHAKGLVERAEDVGDAYTENNVHE